MNITKLRNLLGIKTFLLCVSLCALSFLAHLTYFNGSIRMIEKQYGLSARQSGILDGADNSMVIAFLLIYGYIGDRYNKPRLIGFGTFMIAISSFIMALPHFVISPPSHDAAVNGTAGFEFNNETGGFVRSRVDIMCSAENKTCSGVTSHQDLATSEAGTRAFYILVAGRFIFGFGASSMYTLIVAYIYENSDKHKSPLYLGILNSIYMLGPIFGYLMAGSTNRLPVDLKDYSLKPSDPRFIGCWWMGFIVVGVIGLVGCIPVSTFPASLKPEKGKEKKEKDQKGDAEGFAGYVKGFFRSVRNLITSPLFVLYTLSKIFLCYVLILFIKMMPRYLEFHFRLPVYKTTLITGGALTVPAIFGSFLGGYILSRFKLRDVSTARLVAAMLLVQAGLVGVMMAFQCPQTQFEGVRYDVTTGHANLTRSCSSHCKCDVAGAQPVCGSDGRDYFTPCSAGCTGVSLEGGKVNFTNCQCVAGGWAVPGTCLTFCPTVIPYVVVKALSSFCGTFIGIPARILLIRAIPAEAKAFGLAFGSFTYNLLGFLPGPILAGALVDRSCLIWQRRCGRRGSCLQYNVSHLRAYTHGGAMLCFFMSCIVATICYLIHRRMAKAKGHENGDVIDKLKKYREDEETKSLKDSASKVEMKYMKVVQNGGPETEPTDPEENGSLIAGKGAKQ